MKILLSSAKLMTAQTNCIIPQPSKPQFNTQAQQLVHELCRLSTSEFAQLLHCNEEIAGQNRLRYMNFMREEEYLPAIFSYNGQVYKGLQAHRFNTNQLAFAQQHLLITSSLYGLLRPLDLIHPYRLEGKAKLEITNNQSIFNFWKDILTRHLVQSVQADGGTLVQLSTKEFEQLFHWKAVEAAVRIVRPHFMVSKNGKLKVVTVYAKTCRGAMTRFIIEHNIQTPQQLQAFEFEGFHYEPSLSTPNEPMFVR